MLTELAQPAKRVVGTKQIVKKFAADELKMLVVASDAQEHIKQRLLSLAGEKGVPVIHIASMTELGKRCGIAVGSAAAGILKQVP